MQCSLVLASPELPQAETKSRLLSFDSGHKSSLDHWLEVSWLPEHEEDDLRGYLFEDSCFVALR